MTKIAVHVTTLYQWKSVLDVWFAQGYKWCQNAKEYHENYFIKGGSRYLNLSFEDDGLISIYSYEVPNEFIEYTDFMKQEEHEMAKETYYVTQEQLDLIEIVRKSEFPTYDLILMSGFRKLVRGFKSKEDKDLLKYLGGDTSIEFKVKEQLYRLWRVNSLNNKVYMMFSYSGTPDWSPDEHDAFTAPREEIEKHKTVSWEIEKAD